MSEDASKTKDREFQYEMTKLQVDFEFNFTVLIGLLAIGYGLLIFYRDNSLGYGLTIAVIVLVALGLVVVKHVQKQRFKEIRAKYKLFQPMTSEEPKEKH